MSRNPIITIHDAADRPDMWFFKSTAEKNTRGIPRCKMLPNQIMPTVTSTGAPVNTDYAQVDTSANVQAPYEIRKQNPPGTIFVTMAMEPRYGTSSGRPGALFYNAGDHVAIVDGPNQNASREVIQAYEKFLRTGKAPKLPVAVPEVPSATGSNIDRLLRMYPRPTPEDRGIYVDPLTWQRLIHNYDRGAHSLLTGPDGTAKTELAQLIGATHGLPTETVDMGAKLDPIASLLGQNKFDTKVGSYFDRAPFTYHIEKPGTVIFDEISRAHPTANNILFPVLDSRRMLQLDNAGENLRSIPVHSGCRFLATANEGYMYTGTKGLDTALRSRFKVVPIDYMPEAEEVKVLHVRTRLERRSCETIVKVATTLRTHYKQGALSVGASTRATLDAADLAEAGFPLHNALKLAFGPLYMQEEAPLVRDILSAR